MNTYMMRNGSGFLMHVSSHAQSEFIKWKKKKTFVFFFLCRCLVTPSAGAFFRRNNLITFTKDFYIKRGREIGPTGETSGGQSLEHCTIFPRFFRLNVICAFLTLLLLPFPALSLFFFRWFFFFSFF